MKELMLRNVQATDGKGSGKSEVRYRYIPGFYFPPACGSAKKGRRELRPVRPPHTDAGRAAAAGAGCWGTRPREGLFSIPFLFLIEVKFT